MRCLLLTCALLFAWIHVADAKILTYNQADEVNLRDEGVPTDERATHCLIARGKVVYGVTSGDQCHVFRYESETGTFTILATLAGPNTVMKGLAIDGDSLYVGAMLTPDQLYAKQRKNDRAFDPEDANLIPIESSDNTGRLFRVSGINGVKARVEDLGTPVAGQGIHTLAIDSARQVIYGVTAPGGRFFIYHFDDGATEQINFGVTYTNVSDHQVGGAEVLRELAELTPGEGEWNNRLIPMAMHVRANGLMYTSGWRGQLLKYDPSVVKPADRFSAVAYIPSVPGRQHWNRIDAIVEHRGMLYLGTSDGYLVRFNPDTEELENLGKPIRAIEVAGMVVSPIDECIYGVSGGGLEGMSRLWSYNLRTGVYEVDFPALQVIPNRHGIGAAACTVDGTIVLAESTRTANLWTLTMGEPVEWEKSGVLEEWNPQEAHPAADERDRFAGHKMLEVDVYPIPSAYHGGSGYTAIKSDNDGKIYVGTAYYGKTAHLVQLDPESAEWRSLFRSDELTGQYGRGQGIPGKIHTKLRRGDDGKIYGAMKQGYELHYAIRADVGEAPEGERGSQFTCHFFSYDPATDTSVDLGPGWPQEGVTSFAVDTDRGYLYGATVPGVFFLVYDLETKRVWNAGNIARPHPTRYMPSHPGTGRVYHPGETTPEGRNFMTVWDPDEMRLRDIEIAPEEGFAYAHSYATECGGPDDSHLYGQSGDFLFAMDLEPDASGKLRVRPVCKIGVDGEAAMGQMYAIERGPDGRIYWSSTGGNNVPLALFAWDPKTETKTYLGSCALGGEWIRGSYAQGLCLDPEGNLALHVLYAKITEKQQKHWKVTPDFEYSDIENRPYYRGFPAHNEGTYYSVFYVKNATDMH